MNTNQCKKSKQNVAKKETISTRSRAMQCIEKTRKQLANTTYSYGTKIMPTFRLLLAKRMLVHSRIQRARSTYGNTNTCLYWNGTCAEVGTVSFGTWNVRASGKWQCTAALHVGQRAKQVSVLCSTKYFAMKIVSDWRLRNGILWTVAPEVYTC